MRLALATDVPLLLARWVVNANNRNDEQTDTERIALVHYTLRALANVNNVSFLKYFLIDYTYSWWLINWYFQTGPLAGFYEIRAKHISRILDIPIEFARIAILAESDNDPVNMSDEEKVVFLWEMLDQFNEYDIW